MAGNGFAPLYGIMQLYPILKNNPSCVGRIRDICTLACDSLLPMIPYQIKAKVKSKFELHKEGLKLSNYLNSSYSLHAGTHERFLFLWCYKRDLNYKW